jgi:hypothetical protein
MMVRYAIATNINPTAIAIDFGTSNTVVSILEPDTQTPKTLRFPSLSRVFSLGDTIATGGEIAVIENVAIRHG